ncbi:MAG: hypothetical protein ACE5OQ_15320 [Woeseia sp.]
MKWADSALVVAHLVAALWHAEPHTELEIVPPALKNIYIYTVILTAPVAGAILVWTRFFVSGAALFGS